MRSLAITLAAGATALLLSGCPDIPGGPVPEARSDSHSKSSHARRAPPESVARRPDESSAHGGTVHHSVGEIAWFQGTIDEAFSRRGCPESRPRRTLLRF